MATEVKFKRNTLEVIKQTPVEDGSVLFSTNTTDIFMDVGDERKTYNSETLSIDTTLTQSGKAADAKVTGDKIGQLSDKIDNAIGVPELINISYTTGGYIDKETGIVIPYDGWKYTDFIPIITGIPIKVVNSTSGGNTNYNAYFDEDKNFIKAFNNSSGVLNYLPDNAKYIRLSLPNSAKLSMYYMFNFYNKINMALDGVDAAKKEVSRIKTTENANTLMLRNSGLIPSYYIEYPNDPTDFSTCIDYLGNKINSVPIGKKKFIFITDTHCSRNRGQAINWSQDIPYLNSGHSTSLIAYIAETKGINTVIHGGDIIDSETDRFKATRDLYKYNAEMTGSIGRIKFFPTVGNHDFNSGTTTEELIERRIPSNELYKAVFRPLEPFINQDNVDISGLVDISDEDKTNLQYFMYMHYYHDDTENNIRYIHVTTSIPNLDFITNIFGISSSYVHTLQFDWLYNTLMNTPDGYDVVLVGHMIMLYEYSQSSSNPVVAGYGLDMCQMLSALKLKTSMKVDNITEGNSNFYKMYASGLHEYDFSKANNVGKVIVVCGDMHWDDQCVCHYVDGNNETNYRADYISSGDTINDGEVLVCCTQSDCVGTTQYDGTSYADKVHKMTDKTITEHCFDIITIQDNRVDFTRFGAGNNRVFIY